MSRDITEAWYLFHTTEDTDDPLVTIPNRAWINGNADYQPGPVKFYTREEIEEYEREHHNKKHD